MKQIVFSIKPGVYEQFKSIQLLLCQMGVHVATWNYDESAMKPHADKFITDLLDNTKFIYYHEDRTGCFKFYKKMTNKTEFFIGSLQIINLH